MSEKALTDADGRPCTGQDVLYREKGVTALDVQRAADALLRRGQKPSIAAFGKSWVAAHRIRSRRCSRSTGSGSGRVFRRVRSRLSASRKALRG